MLIAADDPRVTWGGTVSLEKGKDGVRPWRLPCAERDLFWAPSLIGKAAMGAGVRVGLKTDAESVTFHIRRRSPPPPASGAPAARYDVAVDGELWRTVDLAPAGRQVRVDGLPRGWHVVELWLAVNNEVALRGMEIPDNAKARGWIDRRPRWLTYGSSITHCARAASPLATWPALVAAARGWNHTNLGYGGECKLDNACARLLRDLPADVISLKLGINCMGELAPRTFPPAVIGLIRTIREKHARAPIVVCSPIFSPPRETAPSRTDYTLRRMRADLAAIVEMFRGRGDGNIHYVDGLKLFGPRLAKYLPDDLHPDAEGIRRLAAGVLKEFGKLPLP